MMEDKFVLLKVKVEDLEESISGLSALKPILQKQVMFANAGNIEQGKVDSMELGKHFDTAIKAMAILISAYEQGDNNDKRDSNVR